MKIKMLDINGKGYLISFNRHDYKEKEIDKKTYMIDGGQYEGYFRSSGGTIVDKELKDSIDIVRDLFYWGKNYDINNVRLKETKFILLKDLESSHILNILSYFNNKEFNKLIAFEENGIVYDIITKQWLLIHEIFTQELIYRINYNLI